ncbi:MAG: HD domain-containing protein [Desulfobulbaceae bacterium]|nr:HD domain-containing protein [Desulfobulbaceae bacterium]
MQKAISTKITRNLIIGGVTLSIIIGIIVSYIELERIDDSVIELAISTSKEHISLYHEYYHNKDKITFKHLNDRLLKSIEDNTFILIEYYDKTNHKLVEHFNPLKKNIITYIEDKHHNFPKTNKISYDKTYRDGELYLQILTPLLDIEDNHIIGYMDGIYHVTDEKLKEIKERVLLSLAQNILAVIVTTFLLYPIIILLDRDLIKRTDQLLEANLSTLKSLGNAIAKRDSDTNEHNYRVTIFAIRLAEKVKLKPHEIRSLIKGAFLHDIGKIGVPDSILLKPADLTDQEFEAMKHHVSYGSEIIKDNKWLIRANEIIRYHHEHYDGNGYMIGIKKNGIPIIARIFSIADVFDALISKRPYKTAFNLEDSLDIIKKKSGNHFDPTLVKIFIPLAPELYRLTKELDNETLLSVHLQSLIVKYFNK